MTHSFYKDLYLANPQEWKVIEGLAKDFGLQAFTDGVCEKARVFYECEESLKEFEQKLNAWRKGRVSVKYEIRSFKEGVEDRLGGLF